MFLKPCKQWDKLPTSTGSPDFFHLVVPQEMGGCGEPSELQDVQHVEGTATAFAALRGNGTIVCWGHPMLGEGRETTAK